MKSIWVFTFVQHLLAKRLFCNTWLGRAVRVKKLFTDDRVVYLIFNTNALDFFFLFLLSVFLIKTRKRLQKVVQFFFFSSFFAHGQRVEVGLSFIIQFISLCKSHCMCEFQGFFNSSFIHFVQFVNAKYILMKSKLGQINQFVFAPMFVFVFSSFRGDSLESVRYLSCVNRARHSNPVFFSDAHISFLFPSLL